VTVTADADRHVRQGAHRQQHARGRRRPPRPDRQLHERRACRSNCDRRRTCGS
jgi:hypothetical protein